MRYESYTDKIPLTDHQGNVKNIYVTFCKDASKLKDTLCATGKAGSEERGMAQALGEQVSLNLQNGVSKKRIAKTLRGIDCGLRGTYQGQSVTGLPDIIAVALGGA
jgi:ribonucleoside-diphosphate reductase alpha chain